MQERLMYVEAKDGGHSGDAWIGFVSFSKTGAALYFIGRAYRSLKGRGVAANYADVETAERFWISGVKKGGTNRHKFGSGVIHVDRRAAPLLLRLLGASVLDPARFVVGEPVDTSARRGELQPRRRRHECDVRCAAPRGPEGPPVLAGDRQLPRIRDRQSQRRPTDDDGEQLTNLSTESDQAHVPVGGDKFGPEAGDLERCEPAWRHWVRPGLLFEEGKRAGWSSHRGTASFPSDVGGGGYAPHLTNANRPIGGNVYGSACAISFDARRRSVADSVASVAQRETPTGPCWADVVPFPSCPYPFAPQHVTWPL
jgi:hypothetical protein